jgi:hypothetical protein
MPKRRYLGIESKDFVRRTGRDSKKRARLLEKLESLLGRARFLAVRERIPAEKSEEEGRDEFGSRVQPAIEAARSAIDGPRDAKRELDRS